jgi:hypothetical protein
VVIKLKRIHSDHRESTRSEPDPNPSNRTISLRYSVPEKCSVKIFIFDSDGHRVRILYTGTGEMERHVVRWDGNQANGQYVHAGTHLAKLESSGKTIAEKLNCIK